MAKDSEKDTTGEWTWRFRFVVAAFLLANALGFSLFGLKFIVLGWLFNVPCGLFHYFAIERPHDAEDPLGTTMIVAMPWAQTLLTSLVVGGGLIWIGLWYIQQFFCGDDVES